MAYSRELIATAKALMVFGIGPKLLSRVSDIPYHTLREWDWGQRQASVAPDESVIAQLKALLR